MSKIIFKENKVAEVVDLNTMTATGFASDDGSKTFKSEYSYQIGSQAINSIYVHGNCCFSLLDSSGDSIITFQPATTDGRVVNFYMKEDVDCCIYTWVGRSKYNGSDDLTFQVKIFSNGNIEFLCMGSYTNTSSKITIHQNSQNLTFNYKSDVSYVFIPEQNNGINYSMKVGALTLQDIFYLIEDSDGSLKAYNEESKQYEQIGIMPYSKDMFMESGYYEYIKSNGIISEEPIIHIFSLSDKNFKANYDFIRGIYYKLELKEIYNVSDLKIKNITTSITHDEGCDVKFALNRNGEGWVSFKNGSWVNVDISSQDEILNKCMSKSEIESLTELNFADFNYFKFAIFVKKDKIAKNLKLNNITFNYINPEIIEVEV